MCGGRCPRRAARRRVLGENSPIPPRSCRDSVSLCRWSKSQHMRTNRRGNMAWTRMPSSTGHSLHMRFQARRRVRMSPYGHITAAKSAASHLAPVRGLLGSGLRLGLPMVFLHLSANNPVYCLFPTRPPVIASLCFCVALSCCFGVVRCCRAAESTIVPWLQFRQG